MEEQVESWHKLQERLDPNFLQGYRELMDKMGRAARPLWDVSQKVAKEESTKSREDKATRSEDVDDNPTKEKGSDTDNN